MTKKEQAMVEALRRKLALRWTDAVEPDVMPPQGAGHTEGWRVVYDRVERAWSECVAHGSGEYPKGNDRWSGGASQRGIALHSTKVRALWALRYDTAMRAAMTLREVDQQLEAEGVEL